MIDAQTLLTQPQALLAHVQAALARRGGPPPRELPAGVRRAAVLLVLVHARGEAALLLTKRSHLVEHHKGQISLPGGVVEPGESPLDAALRETSEEIGVRAQDVTILGALHLACTAAPTPAPPIAEIVRSMASFHFASFDAALAAALGATLDTAKSSGKSLIMTARFSSMYDTPEGVRRLSSST